MEELLTIGIALSAQNTNEDKNNDVVGDVLGAFDDGVCDQKDHTDILETVRGQKESNSSSLNGITEDGLNFLVNLAGIKDSLGFLDEGQKFGLGFKVFGVLRIKWLIYLSKFGDLFFNLGSDEFH